MEFLQARSVISPRFISQTTLLNRRWFSSIAGSALSLSAFGILLGMPVVSLGISLNAWAQPAAAQALPTCQPPRENQFLLLVLDQRSDTQAQLKQLLPDSAVLTSCNYLSNSVVRVEGFSSADIANAWAKYISDRIGLQAFVARSANSAIVTTPTLAQPQIPTQPTTPQTAAPTGNTGSGSSSGSSSVTLPATYNPQPLGAGYAVLVNYFNRPEIATDVSQITTSAVGLVAYNQHPYLLAIYTNSETTAAGVLKALSDRGFTAVMVDSRRVMLLKQNVVN